MVINRKKRKITEQIHLIKEAIEVEGAQFLGNKWGLDLFKINTWNALCAFNDNETTTAGRHAQDEGTFNSHVANNENVNMYIMAYEDTNNVKYCLVVGVEGNINFVTEDNISIPFNSNIQIEDSNAHEVQNIHENIPLFLIPNLRNRRGDGYIISESILEGVLDMLADNGEVVFEIPQEVTQINTGAFNSTFINSHNNNIIIPESITTIQPRSFSSAVFSRIEVENDDETWWENDWINGDPNNVDIQLGINLSDEERAERERERDRVVRDHNQTEADNIVSIIEHTLTNEIVDFDADTGDAIFTCEDALDHASPEVRELIPQHIFELVANARATFDRLQNEDVLQNAKTNLIASIDDSSFYKELLQKSLQNEYKDQEIKLIDPLDISNNFDTVIDNVRDQLSNILSDTKTVISQIQYDPEMNFSDQISEIKNELIQKILPIFKTELERLYKIKNRAEEEKFIYKKVGNSMWIIRPKKDVTGEVKIPTHIQNLPVEVIDSYAFYNNTRITKVTIPETIKAIKSYAFDEFEGTIVFDNSFRPDFKSKIRLDKGSIPLKSDKIIYA